MTEKNNNKNTIWCFSFSSPIIVALSLFIVGCSDGGIGANVNLDERIYFDLKEYLNSEEDRLSSLSSFSKVVYVNDKKEQKQIRELDFEKELKPFYDSDINRPAWSDKYEIDSVLQNGVKLKSLIYTALDKKLKTQKMNIEFEGAQVSLIKINNATKSSVADTYQILTYEPNQGFSIESRQDVAMMDENKFRIEITFE